MLPYTLEVTSCRGLNSQAHVTDEVVLHLLGSMLWPTFKYFDFSKKKRKIKVLLSHVKTRHVRLEDYSY